MGDKFKNKYRIPSARLRNWDYGWAGVYFITICTHDMAHHFGEVEGEDMILSPVGVIADIMWHEIVGREKHVEKGEFVVMPNHVHGLLILKSSADGAKAPRSAPGAKDVGDWERVAEEPRLQHDEKNEFMSKISPKPGSVSTIVRSYKSAVTRHARRMGFSFEWQARFYDNILRNERDLHRVSRYIVNNPRNWAEDRFALGH